jgi:hypothetical protein
MRISIATLICLVIISCGQTGTLNNGYATNEIPKRKIDKYLENIFFSKYPNYQDNEMIRDKATIELRKTIDSLYKNKYLEDVPLKIFKIKKNPHGKGAIVQFYADNQYEVDTMLSNELGFDVIGLMSEELASTLSESSDKKYFIYGHNYNRVTQPMADILVGMTYYSTVTEISTLSYSTKFKIGNFICEIDSLK